MRCGAGAAHAGRAIATAAAKRLWRNCDYRPAVLQARSKPWSKKGRVGQGRRGGRRPTPSPAEAVGRRWLRRACPTLLAFRCVSMRPASAPKGRHSIAQGASPGDQVSLIAASPNGALPPMVRGRVVTPLRGYDGLAASRPRAAPWASESRPFGAETTAIHPHGSYSRPRPAPAILRS